MASVSLIIDTQQYYYVYTGNREARRNNCRSLAVMVKFCSSHHSIWTRTTTSGVRNEAKTRLSALLAHRRRCYHLATSPVSCPRLKADILRCPVHGRQNYWWLSATQRIQFTCLCRPQNPLFNVSLAENRTHLTFLMAVQSDNAAFMIFGCRFQSFR